YTHIYTLSTEHRLARNMALTIAYTGSRTMKLITSSLANRGEPVAGIPATTANIDQRRPDPRFQGIQTYTNLSIAYYDALQIALARKLSHGMSLNAQYTFSKALNSGDTSFVDVFGGAHFSQNADVVGDLKGVEQFDIPHSLTVGFTFDSP